METDIEGAIMLYSVPVSLAIALSVFFGMFIGYASTVTAPLWLKCRGITITTFAGFVGSLYLLYDCLPHIRLNLKQEAIKTKKEKKERKRYETKTKNVQRTQKELREKIAIAMIMEAKMENSFSAKSIDGILTKGIYTILSHTYVWQKRHGEKKTKKEKQMKRQKLVLPGEIEN